MKHAAHIQGMSIQPRIQPGAPAGTGGQFASIHRPAAQVDISDHPPVALTVRMLSDANVLDESTSELDPNVPITFGHLLARAERIDRAVAAAWRPHLLGLSESELRTAAASAGMDATVAEWVGRVGADAMDELQAHPAGARFLVADPKEYTGDDGADGYGVDHEAWAQGNAAALNERARTTLSFAIAHNVAAQARASQAS